LPVRASHSAQSVGQFPLEKKKTYLALNEYGFDVKIVNQIFGSLSYERSIDLENVDCQITFSRFSKIFSFSAV
jgi:hypothetical protein